MADFARFLPLSQGRPGDEPGVHSDRREPLAVVVERAAALVGSAEDAPARAEAFARTAALRDEYAASDVDDDPGARLRAVAGRVRGGAKRSIRSLADAVTALLVLARELGVDPQVDAATAGSVALWASAHAPFDRRAVIRGHTVQASDAEWSFGKGPTLVGTATQIAAFLLGASDKPPQPLTGRR